MYFTAGYLAVVWYVLYWLLDEARTDLVVSVTGLFPFSPTVLMSGSGLSFSLSIAFPLAFSFTSLSSSPDKIQPVRVCMVLLWVWSLSGILYASSIRVIWDHVLPVALRMPIPQRVYAYTMLGLPEEVSCEILLPFTPLFPWSLYVLVM